MWCNMLWQQIVINQQMQKTWSMKVQFAHMLPPWLNCSVNYNSCLVQIWLQEQPINLRIWQSTEQNVLLRYGAIQRNNKDPQHQLVSEFTAIGFWVCSQNWNKRLLASSFQHVRPSACNNLAPNGWIIMKFDTWVFVENLSQKFKLN